MRNARRHLFLTVGVLVTLLGCLRPEQDRSARVPFVTKYTAVEFYFPAGWYENLKEHPFDLQCFSPLQDMNTGVFCYKKTDLEADETPTDIFHEQVDDLRSKRSSFQEFEPSSTVENDQISVTSVVYLGEKDSEKFCYRFAFIQFKADPSRFAVALQVALPEEWEKAKPILEEITLSAKPMPDATETAQ